MSDRNTKNLENKISSLQTRLDNFDAKIDNTLERLNVDEKNKKKLKNPLHSPQLTEELFAEFKDRTVRTKQIVINNLTSFLTTGGEVLIAVSKQLISTPIATSCICLGPTFVAISTGSLKVVVGVTFIPPNSPANVYELHAANAKEVSLKYSDHNILLKKN
ncbi:hypothetical protein TSAR_004000 [Trichomalopsis sarcophagae]|uniref:Uncharacterized protein n=1 Tax=Trichomalopsis sarcophagae TaxID=543379 RepID=A0A232EKX9_9HYME|nr:hypothetical protein TSAR_004000 [Trichomalopsis sarcophagae]